MDICPEQRIDPPESAEVRWIDDHWDDQDLMLEYLADHDDPDYLHWGAWLSERYRNTVEERD